MKIISNATKGIVLLLVFGQDPRKHICINIFFIYILMLDIDIIFLRQQKYLLFDNKKMVSQ